jgi:hypothetical protein
VDDRRAARSDGWIPYQCYLTVTQRERARNTKGQDMENWSVEGGLDENNGYSSLSSMPLEARRDHVHVGPWRAARVPASACSMKRAMLSFADSPKVRVQQRREISYLGRERGPETVASRLSETPGHAMPQTDSLFTEAAKTWRRMSIL